jgi:hypothetical protein
VFVTVLLALFQAAFYHPPSYEALRTTEGEEAGETAVQVTRDAAFHCKEACPGSKDYADHSAPHAVAPFQEKNWLELLHGFRTGLIFVLGEGLVFRKLSLPLLLIHWRQSALRTPIDH